MSTNMLALFETLPREERCRACELELCLRSIGCNRWIERILFLHLSLMHRRQHLFSARQALSAGQAGSVHSRELSARGNLLELDSAKGSAPCCIVVGYTIYAEIQMPSATYRIDMYELRFEAPVMTPGFSRRKGTYCYPGSPVVIMNTGGTVVTACGQRGSGHGQGQVSGSVTMNESCSLQREISSLLESEWDPIGVYKGHPGQWPPDEYELYSQWTLEVFRSGGGRVELLLAMRSARDRMGLSPDVEADARAAESLVTWWTAKKADDI